MTKNAANAHRFDRIRVNGINVGWTAHPDRARPAVRHPRPRLGRRRRRRLALRPAVPAAGDRQPRRLPPQRRRRPDDRRPRRPGAVGRGREPMSLRLSPATLARLPPAVRRPGYDRTALAVGMAHVGVGAFHRCHQAEFTDDMLAARFDRWGVAGISIRPPALGPTLGAQAGLYTRVLADGERREARVIGCHVASIDAQSSPEPALAALADPAVEVVTITVTEKGYCHRPADGSLDEANPDIGHDRARPEAPRSLPGLIAAALDRRRTTHGRPLTAHQLRQHPRQRRRPRRRRRLPRRRPPCARRLDRRQRRLPLDHGRPHRPGDHARGPRRARGRPRLRRRRPRRRRALPPVGDRGPLRRPPPAVGSSPAPSSSPTSRPSST